MLAGARRDAHAMERARRLALLADACDYALEVLAVDDPARPGLMRAALLLGRHRSDVAPGVGLRQVTQSEGLGRPPQSGELERPFQSTAAGAAVEPTDAGFRRLLDDRASKILEWGA